jgi:hypothetical protein
MSSSCGTWSIALIRTHSEIYGQLVAAGVRVRTRSGVDSDLGPEDKQWEIERVQAARIYSDLSAAQSSRGSRRTAEEVSAAAAQADATRGAAGIKASAARLANFSKEHNLPANRYAEMTTEELKAEAMQREIVLGRRPVKAAIISILVQRDEEEKKKEDKMTGEQKDAQDPPSEPPTEEQRQAELKRQEELNEKYIAKYLNLYQETQAFSTSNSRTRNQTTANASPAETVLKKGARKKPEREKEFNPNTVIKQIRQDMKALAAQQKEKVKEEVTATESPVAMKTDDASIAEVKPDTDDVASAIDFVALRPRHRHLDPSPQEQWRLRPVK